MIREQEQYQEQRLKEFFLDLTPGQQKIYLESHPDVTPKMRGICKQMRYDIDRVAKDFEKFKGLSDDEKAKKLSEKHFSFNSEIKILR